MRDNTPRAVSTGSDDKLIYSVRGVILAHGSLVAVCYGSSSVLNSVTTIGTMSLKAFIVLIVFPNVSGISIICYVGCLIAESTGVCSITLIEATGSSNLANVIVINDFGVISYVLKTALTSVSGVALCLTGRLCNYRSVDVSCCRNNLLSNNYAVTSVTVDTIGHASGEATGFVSGNNNLAMTKSRLYNVVTNDTNCAFGTGGFGKGNVIVCLNEYHSTAVFTNLSSGTGSLSTGLMAKGLCFHLNLEYKTAVEAVAAFGKTALGTGCGNRRIDLSGVTLCLDFFCVAIATLTGEG